jgi:threonine aldolase
MSRPNPIVDLRSDTVTRPTPEMYDAMRSAALGDDVLGDDPTVHELEDLASRLTGKPAAVFVPSGTMGNQIALASHCSPGDAVLFEEEAHILYYECGSPALIAGVVGWTIPSDHGILDPGEVERRILKRSLHTPGTRLLCLENTHNRAGGTVIPLDLHQEYRRIADRHGLAIHLDGARVFNAAIALGVPVTEIARHVDSITFCLSKGLSSPVGSVLCGEADFIEAARQWRKRLGGGMRQAGILAACGLVSLRTMVDRLREDHRRAKVLADGLSRIAGLAVPNPPETNIVMVRTEVKAEEWTRALHERGVWCYDFDPHRLRMVLHKDIDDHDVARALEACAAVALDLAA